MVAGNADVLVGNTEEPTGTSAFVRLQVYWVREVQVLFRYALSGL